jgi:diguanylate cyclase (GGDEF)-like protein
MRWRAFPSPGSRPRAILVAATVAVALTLLAGPRFSLWLRTAFPAAHDSIRNLQELPAGAVAHLLGVVTYTDPAGKRFWIQDDTGAIAINQDPQPYGLQVGQSVRVQGRKTHPYDPLVGATSVGLSDIKVTPAKVRLKLAAPPQASLKSLPAKERTGMRVQLSGVVRRITRDRLGRVQLAFGDGGQEATATLASAQGDTSQWENAKVRIICVGEVTYGENGRPLDKYLWIQDSSDIRIQEPAPKAAPLYSVRTLYSDAAGRNGHRVRVRGWVAAQLTENSVLVEDRWGAVACDSDQPSALAAGTPVEASGFPTTDGVRIDLFHSSIVPISAQVEVADKDSPTPLTTVAAIRDLSVQQANDALPVRITGVVTYNDPGWKQLFLQDHTGGIYVKYGGSRVALEQGQRLTIVGITNAGDYAPIIVSPKFIAFGKGQLPRPIRMTAADASSGVLDSQFVEVEGVVHPLKLHEEPGHLTFELYTSFGQMHVFAGPTFSRTEYLQNLADATVRIRGVCGTVFNSRRQLVGYQLSVSSAEEIEVLEAASADWFDKAPIAIDTLLRFSPHADFSHRIKVQGSVTMLGRGFFYLQDESGGLEVQADTKGLRLADLVEAVGYASPGGGYSPVLRDAAVHMVKHDVSVPAASVTAQSVLQGRYDSRLVTMDGRLLSVADSPNGKSLVLQSGVLTFGAQLDTLDSTAPVPRLKEGSVLQLTGVCSVQVDPSKLYLLLAQQPVGFRLVLRSPQDVVVLQPASWWTASHSVFVLGILTALILATFAWASVLRGRVRRQTEALQTAAEEAKAIRNLAGAMQEVTLQKNFEASVSVSGSPEIAQLGVEFNRMLAELQQRDLAKREAEAKLQRQALTDELTGLPNRRLLSDRLAQTLAIAARARHMVALLYIDLDGFKLVNDSLGHTVGDALLGQVAERLRSRIRESDTLARLGGDEFTAVVMKLHSKKEAGSIAKSLLESLAAPFFVENHEITISASIGISIFPDDGSDGTDLLQQADSAMYAAKRSGKNQVMYFTAELGSSVRERLNLENQLRGAVTRGEINLHYQPEFEVVSRRLIRFEALARWIHPTLGAIPPSKFIPIAEESGLIVSLGAHIMEHACAEAVKWQNSSSSDPIQVAVNVSSLQFVRDSFVEEVIEVLRHTGLKPSLLQIELTESVMLSGAERVADTMKRLRAMGVSLAIDDFGTGYSCFGYLPKFPFNALKIDRSFVHEIETRPETKAMVHSLVTLAHNLNMQVIVEGIETPKQLEMIKDFGGNQVQGFLLGRPTADPLSQLRANRRLNTSIACDRFPDLVHDQQTS